MLAGHKNQQTSDLASGEVVRKTKGKVVSTIATAEKVTPECTEYFTLWRSYGLVADKVVCGDENPVSIPAIFECFFLSWGLRSQIICQSVN